MGTGAVEATKTRAVAAMGTETGTRTGLVKAEERRRSVKTCPRVVDAMGETGETWVKEKNVHKEGFVQ